MAVVNQLPMLTMNCSLQGSRTRVLHYSRFKHAHSEPEISMRAKAVSSASNGDGSITSRILALDFNSHDFQLFEQLQIEGKTDEIWAAVRRNPGNEELAKYMRLSAAIEAVERNNMKRLRQVIDDDVVRARDPRGMRLLHVAVLKERHEMVELIVSEFPQAIDLTDQSGRTAIHYAAAQPNAIYDTLIDLGADPNIADAVSHSKLIPEAFRRSPDRLRRTASAASSLMLRSMSPDDEFYDPDAPAEHVIDEWIADGEVGKLEQLVLDGRGHMLKEKTTENAASKEFLRGLTVYQSKIDAIHKAVEEGDVRRVKSLIDRQQLALARDNYGMTPLHKALLHGQTNTVRHLLAKYPQCVNATDHAGRTPLHYAAADPNGEHMIKVPLNNPESFTFIIMLDLDLEEDIYDWIHTGNVGKLEELVLNGYGDLLLGRNHEVEDADSIGFLEVLPQYQAKVQAIHKAVETGNLRAVRLLTDRKKLALCRDSRGLSPLHKAIVFDRPDIAKYLIRNYPHVVNAMDQKKRTPLHYAAAFRDGGYLYKMMRKSGADPNIYDCNGRPAKYYLKHVGEVDLAAMRLDTRAALKQVLHNRVAPSYLESSIQQWLRDGQLPKLEQLVLSGCGDLLQNRNATNPETATFLENLPEYMGKLRWVRDRLQNKRTSMHYAAAARDGGHYLKILGKAGADPMAVDNEGRTPDYYRRNAVIDLKMIKDRDEEYEVMSEEMLDEGPMLESPGSGESEEEGSAPDSARIDEENDEMDRHRFEKMVHGRTDLPTSENGIYLARTVAPVLTKALAEVLLRRPADPIGFISDYLLKYHNDRSNGRLK
ncbi:unnamed protein product [Nippostrongylus brasiliensis]|uniref:ANK_REP_REGION domain-containing protein n=1 Tax=Nippostrongylus brasiliensis TaxID=27835 RepID=A0A158R104_NIPBR|nr:unnamed protein product [Nippostrongylus brasiliensis]